MVGIKIPTVLFISTKCHQKLFLKFQIFSRSTARRQLSTSRRDPNSEGHIQRPKHLGLGHRRTGRAAKFIRPSHASKTRRTKKTHTDMVTLVQARSFVTTSVISISPKTRQLFRICTLHMAMMLILYVSIFPMGFWGILGFVEDSAGVLQDC